MPFYNLPLQSLLQIYNTTKKDKDSGFCDNRLYYIANRIQVFLLKLTNILPNQYNLQHEILHYLQCPPSTLSKHIVRRTFLYKLSFDWLESSLNVLLGKR